MSSASAHYLNSIVGSERRSLDVPYNGWDSKTERISDSNASLLLDGEMSSKSSAELMEEITKLEVQIVHLERHLLSLYQTSFKEHLEKNVERMNGRYPEMELGMLIDFNNRIDQSSRASSFAGLRDSVEDLILSSSFRKRQSAHFRKLSLADHLGDSCILIRPDRLSEEMIQCMSSIYCKLANAVPTKKWPTGATSSASSFGSSDAVSPKNLSGSWSPLYNQYTENCDLESFIKRENEHYRPAIVEVLKISFDDERYSYATAVLDKFRSLVKNLETVDPSKLRREEKLAFWINIHNALLMHAYLAYGTQHNIKTTCMKAAYNVGGHCINAYDIQNSILGIRSHYCASWLQAIVSSGKKLKTGYARHPYALEYPEPLVHFALCSGSYSEPMVRVYRAESVFKDLQLAKEEFIQATVYVHKEKKICLPRILSYYAKDMSIGSEELLEDVGECLHLIQQKSLLGAAEARPGKHLRWLDQRSSFRYLILKEMGR